MQPKVFVAQFYGNENRTNRQTLFRLCIKCYKLMYQTTSVAKRNLYFKLTFTPKNTTRPDGTIHN